MLKEQIVRFGSSKNLVGVFASQNGTDGGAPVAIILNSGVMHRVGAGRISVKLARALAGNGICSLRFDFSSIGDSASGTNDIELNERNIIEIQQAMEFIESKFSQREFVLYGLCSGARDAFDAALSDERVVGIVQIDGYAYRNFQFFVRRYVPRVLLFSRWVNLFSRRIPVVIKNAFKADEKPSDENMFVQVWPAYPPKKQIEEGYLQLVERGVRFLVVFTGSWAEEYNYKNQFFDMYNAVNFNNLVDLEYMPKADHILTDETDRNFVTSRVVKWIASISK